MMRFDGQGFVVEPEGAGWRWGLALQSYGRAGALQPLPSAARISAKDQKVTYTWNQQLDEWYLNDGRGLEHGFTLKQRVAGNTADPVLITLNVRGGLTAHASSAFGNYIWPTSAV